MTRCNQPSAGMEAPKKAKRPEAADAPPILIDTREQHPFAFFHLAKKASLKTGDYSIEGLEAEIAVERKELCDFINCCTNERERFERELDRSWGMRRLWIVVEGCLRTISRGEYRNQVPSEAIIGTVASWENRFSAVRIMFACDRTTAGRMVEKLLLRAWADFAQGKVW